MSSINEIADPGVRAASFIESLTLVGDFAGMPFRLRPWQESIVRAIFGTLRKDGRRQYKRAFIALPRKQAKTTLAAGMLGYLLFGEGVQKRSQQLYSASGDREQAALTFRTLAEMIRADEYLNAHANIHDSYKEIEVPSLNNTYEALSRESRLKHGLSPSAVVFDEVHVLPDRQLHDVLTTGFGARREPLVIYITTAGWDRLSICWELWDYARKIRDGQVADATFLPVLYELAESDDWTDERVWPRVMPALGDFCSMEEIRENVARAQQSTAYENTVKRLFFNIWTERLTRWLPMAAWFDCAADYAEADLQGRPCYVGVDLGRTHDLTALVCYFPATEADPLPRIWPLFWLPQSGVWVDDPLNRDTIQAWGASGDLNLTPGRTLDSREVARALVHLDRVFAIEQVIVDPAFAHDFALRLRDEQGFTDRVQFVRQTPLELNEATVELERLVLSRGFAHPGHPVMNWCAANVSVKTTPTGLLQIEKESPSGRIDGISALINALAGLRLADRTGGSIYDQRDMILL